MKPKLLAAAILVAGSTFALPVVAGEIYVVVNGKTGEVVVAGNAADSAIWLRRNSVARSPEGWEQIFGDDVSGWAAVTCLKTSSSSYFFELSSGHPTEGAARSLAEAAAQKRAPQVGGTIIPGCGFAWNNAGQAIALGPSPAQPETRLADASSVAKTTTPVPAKSNAPGKTATNNRQQILSSTPIGDLGTATIVNNGQLVVPSQKLGTVPSQGNNRSADSSRPTELARTTPPPPPAVDSSSRAGKAQLRCRRATDEDRTIYKWCDENGNPIEDASKGTKTAGKDANGVGGTGSVPGNNGSVDGRPPSQPNPTPGKTSGRANLHLEAVSVCEFVPPQSQFGNWRCLGPSTVTYVNFSKPNWEAALRQGGGKDGTNPRDLGVVGRFRVFGWGYPLWRDPDLDYDAALKLNLPAIAMRYRYRCPAGTRNGCVLE